MNNIDGDAEASQGNLEIAPPASGFLAELRLAFGFLTILPVLGDRAASDQAVAASFAWFPLVGAILGLALCGEDAILSLVFGQVIRSVLIVLTITVLTGGLHLDGLADTADAFGAGRNRERALEILRDSRVGSFGAVAIFFDLTLKILALSTVSGWHRYMALILATALARWAMVSVTDGIDYIREHGAGSALLGERSGSALFRASVIVAMVLLPMLSLRSITATTLALLIALVCRWFYRRWLGGITGDLIGACAEIVEIAVLIVMSA
jgi:adenosylcobinamide-GDP ribazoletransferase